jgi:hypothetical protein
MMVDAAVLDNTVCVSNTVSKSGYNGVRVILVTPFFILALVGGVWTASLPGHFTPLGKRSWYPLEMRLGELQISCGCYGEEKMSCPYKG